MYNKFVNFLKQHNLYDEEIFDFYWNNSFMFDYLDDELREFIGCYFIFDNSKHLKKIMICIPFASDDKTVLINVHEYVHVFLMYPYINKKCKIGMDIEALAIFYEKLYLLENSSPELIEFANYLDSKIFYANKGEYVLAFMIKDKLNELYNKGYNIEKLEKTAKRLVKKEVIKSNIIDLKNKMINNK